MNPSRRFLIPFAVLAMLSPACKESPEARVKRAFDKTVKAIEDGDAGSAAEVLSTRFSGPEGLDFGSAKLYLYGLLRQEKIGITVFSSKIEVRGDEANQSVEVFLTSRSENSLLPQDSSRKTYILRWESKKGEWKLRELQQAGS